MTPVTRLMIVQAATVIESRAAETARDWSWGSITAALAWGSATGCRRSFRPMRGEHHRHGLQQDAEIEGEALPPDILNVEVERLPHGQSAPATDLPQAGETRRHTKALRIGWCHQFRLPWKGRTRSDQPQPTANAGQRLGKLIDAHPAQQPAERSDPRVVLELVQAPPAAGWRLIIRPKLGDVLPVDVARRAVDQ